jgi:hypothetical protein
MKNYVTYGLLACAAFSCASQSNAQAIKAEPPMRNFSAEEVEKIAYPDLKFTETPADVDTYDKYFFFHRDNTSFDEAYADIKECDALTSGIRYYGGGSGAVYSPYGGTLGGAIGGAIGSAMADAIFGSAERRRIRRVNMRSCMGFKEYSRYGMERERWQVFHFEEGMGTVKGEKRENYLLKQAKVASGPKPELKVLEP